MQRVRREAAQVVTAMQRDRAFVWLLVLFVALNVVDLALTLMALHLSGWEANPLFRLLFAHSTVLGILVKLGGTLPITANMAIVFYVLTGAVMLYDGWLVMHLLEL